MPLTDLVAADRLEAQRVCDAVCPSQEFGGLAAKGIDTVKLGTLYAVLTGGELDPTFISESLCDGGEDGPWVFEVPPDLVQRLAGLTSQQLADVGAKWAVTEEFSPKYDNWPTEVVQELLVDIAKLCKKAVDEGKTVLMWMCL